MKIKTMLLACMFAFTSVLYAGVAQSTDVEVDLENRFALGVTTTARASADDNQLIGCQQMPRVSIKFVLLKVQNY